MSTTTLTPASSRLFAVVILRKSDPLCDGMVLTTQECGTEVPGAEAIAKLLQQKIEATRERRRPLEKKIRRKIDKL